MKIIFFIAGVIAAAALFAILILNTGDNRLIQSEISLSSALSGNDTSGFKRALPPAEFRFPQDHGPHEGFKTEWWYYTGNLTTAEGRRFGYQLTFFRTALNPYSAKEGSAWRTNDIFMGHFTVTDVAGKKFYYAEKFSRQAADLAGAAADPFILKIYNWRVTGRPDDIGGTGGYFHVSAEDKETGIDLELSNIKPLILQGENGFSRKGPETGNASYYYSFSRLVTKGTVRINEYDYKVNGYSWMDREWSTSSLNKEQSGWDWFSLQLNDNTELMYYRIRKKDGTEDNYSSCRIIREDGSVKEIAPEQISLKTTAEFITKDGTQYPAGWKLEIKEEAVSFDIKPYVEDQELKTSVRYWEGAVNVSGTARGRPVEGSGYIELTGYSKPGVL